MQTMPLVWLVHCQPLPRRVCPYTFGFAWQKAALRGSGDTAKGYLKVDSAVFAELGISGSLSLFALNSGLEQTLAAAADFKAVASAVGAGHAAGFAGALPAVAAQGLAVGQHAVFVVEDGVAGAYDLGTVAGKAEAAAPVKLAIARFGADGAGRLANFAFHRAGGVAGHAVNIAAGAAEAFGLGKAGSKQKGCGGKGEGAHGLLLISYQMKGVLILSQGLFGWKRVWLGKLGFR